MAVDAPDVPQLYPSGLVQSTRRVYVRLHSRNAGNWYLSDKERYVYHYGNDQLSYGGGAWDFYRVLAPGAGLHVLDELHGREVADVAVGVALATRLGNR